MKFLTQFNWTIILLALLITPITYAEELYVRGHILHFFDNPKTSKNNYQYLEDGLLIIKDKKVAQIGDFQSLKKAIPSNAKMTHYPNGLIVPGFIDTHLHYPQLDMIAANSGGHLLQWLNKYTFPFEKKFKDRRYTDDVANFFLDELIRNGTTSALIFTTIYPQAVNSLFNAAQSRKMRIIAGESMGDRNLPDYLIQDPQQAIAESTELIQQWHNKPDSRLLYAITFRFAPTTSPELFQGIQKLKQDFPDVYLHTHISENQQEVAWSKQLFDTDSYLEIYERYHLLGHKTLLAHGVYLTDEEEKRIHATKTAVAFCPSSNLFLGSGLFDLARANKNQMTVGLGTDVGAGTSFSMLQTLNNAYKVLQLQGQDLTPLEGFYLATLGGARALALEDKLGNFTKGKEADFVVLNLSDGNPLLKRRLAYADTLEDKLFVLMTLGDDRSVQATYVHGELIYQNHPTSNFPSPLPSVPPVSSEVEEHKKS